jgi:sporulation protein YlmC with PRC-barrel domain
MVLAQKLNGKNVVRAAGMILGGVKGIEVNTSTWSITKIAIKLSGQSADSLGFKKRFRSSIVCLPVSLIIPVGDVITVNKSIGEPEKNSEITECIE